MRIFCGFLRIVDNKKIEKRKYFFNCVLIWVFKMFVSMFNHVCLFSELIRTPDVGALFGVDVVFGCGRRWRRR